MILIKLFLFFTLQFLNSQSYRSGEQLFMMNCNSCHIQGTNIIIPEKGLKKEILDTNGLNNINAIIYQIRNGKNGMPAFGGRLTETEIKDIANYVFKTF